MARLTPPFSAHRTVREYTEQHYLPAATPYHLRIANKGAIARQMVDWQHSLEFKWATLHFGEVKVETRGGQHVVEFRSVSMTSTPWRCGYRFALKILSGLIAVVLAAFLGMWLGIR